MKIIKVTDTNKDIKKGTLIAESLTVENAIEIAVLLNNKHCKGEENYRIVADTE